MCSTYSMTLCLLDERIFCVQVHKTDRADPPGSTDVLSKFQLIKLDGNARGKVRSSLNH